MTAHAVLALGVALALVSPGASTGRQAGAPARTISVMSWNVCAATNPACAFYRMSPQELAWNIGRQAVTGQIRPDVIFLQESCTGADLALELALEWRTGRQWTVRSWGLTTAWDGRPYACHPDRQNRPRGTQGVTVAVAGPGAVFTVHPLTAPSWYVRRAAICAVVPAVRVNACGTHLSSGLSVDDRQAGAPYRTRQIRELRALAVRRGYVPIFGGDLNMTPRRPAVAALYRAYGECDGAANGRWTYQQARTGALRKIDYLFAPRGSVRRCHVDHGATGSDHRPIYAEIALPRRPAVRGAGS
ncbi:endonuclease/exonuclease/phosphatase family protein [Spongiactinospora sp. TRM90649]|uniref:endonuclease/exonuclease/phosphatase family protein n=1 Tax=Spongiactinospora sp. TRM90649 TaxID=3031114 RepID=UPI0023F691BD|nr:endonuclease/exonuclease/phosphatase family protein [Spongiactinospora sp. TRM90649]MDF5757692.1 endonuclease/exonuclease/phosphatase family protein [Spongiactinospora sp. TRM90649]